ncbi:MAG: hypothetical protein NVSMB2_05980 [Chloroflexota bacterium]
MSLCIVSTPTLWALVIMEAAFALPLISYPGEGDRVHGAPGALLLGVLLPIGFGATRMFDGLRDPSWRILWAIGLAVLSRLVVSALPDVDPASVSGWIAHSFVPCAIGVGLWWRGAALSATELTASEVRREFIVLSVCVIAVLALVRPFILPDPVLLGSVVVTFTVSGLLAAAFARQDAADAQGRRLVTVILILAVLLGLGLTLGLQPARATAVLTGIGWLIGTLMQPIGWFIAWLVSLLPPLTSIGQATALPRPTALKAPDPATLEALDRGATWVGTLIAAALVLVAGVAILLIVRLMLRQWLQRPSTTTGPPPDQVTSEHAGTPGADASHFLRRLLGVLHPRHWLRRGWRAMPGGRARPHAAPDVIGVSVDDARAAYRGFLAWAARRGITRRGNETPHELQLRMAEQAPELRDAAAEITSTYEDVRYGEHAADRRRVARLRAALKDLGL